MKYLLTLCVLLISTPVVAGQWEDIVPTSLESKLRVAIREMSTYPFGFKGDAGVTPQECEKSVIGKMDNRNINALTCGTKMYGMGVTARGYSSPPVTTGIYIVQLDAEEAWQLKAAVLTVVWAYDRPAIEHSTFNAEKIKALLDAFNATERTLTIQGETATYTVHSKEGVPGLIEVLHK